MTLPRTEARIVVISVEDSDLVEEPVIEPVEVFDDCDWIDVFILFWKKCEIISAQEQLRCLRTICIRLFGTGES
jgi:hypothetical protein